MGLWDFLKGRRPEAGAQAPVAAPVEPPVVVAAPPPLEIPVEPEAEVDVAALALTPRVLDGLKLALTSKAHALLYDPEEYTCIVCTLGNGQVQQVAECSLDGYRESREPLASLDGRLLRFDETVYRVQTYHAVTDLGQRIVLQFFQPEWDGEIVTERRKANVRLLNRLRPGTSLSRHNRETLLGAVKRAGTRPPPTFLERLAREGFVPEALAREDLSDDQKLERVLRREALPRKAMARILGEYLGIPFTDVEENVPRREHGQLFSVKQVLQWEAIPCAVEDDTVHVAVADPTDSETAEQIRNHLGRPVAWRVAAATDIRLAADKIFKSD
ncbi:MAG: hypothetical protein FJX76_12570 [Armatimonadetes bacterium]|nr:hypothetical protein [Armatimonadota bacterium]